jgi:peptidyl-prolyl cis-trans isomerase C
MRPASLSALLAAAAALTLAGPIAPARAQGTDPAAQSAPAGAAGTAAPAPAALKPDTVLAKVNGVEIKVADLTDLARSLPDEYRNMPPQMLMPLLLDQEIDRLAVADLARKQGLDKDPAVQRQLERAADQTLQGALFNRDVGPLISEAKIHARYDTEIAGKPGEEEVHARHILVASEDEANKIIAELKAGGNFEALAKAHSTDPAAQQGGDLGFFKKADMLPEFSAAAFALQPGQISDKPVKTQYGWHVIRLEERRTAPPTPFDQAHDQIRQEIIREGVEKVVAQARAGVTVEKFRPDGSVPRATDTAEPPPPPPAK